MKPKPVHSLKSAKDTRKNGADSTRLVSATTSAIGISRAPSNKEKGSDFISSLKQQVIDMFYNDIRYYMTAIKNSCPPDADINSTDHPEAKAFFTVWETDKAGRISDHIAFDGSSLTHLSKEGNAVMLLYLKLKKQLDPNSVKDE